MKIKIESKSAELMNKIARILKEKNSNDKVSEVLDLLKKENVNWFVENYSIDDDSVTFSIDVR